jgi:hypothetical protein
LRAVLNTGETVFAELTHRFCHFPLVAILSLVDVIDALSHAPSAVEAVILPDDLEFSDLSGW